MAVSIRNLEKYIDDHPEMWSVRKSILDRAKEYTEPNGVISSADILKRILGEIADDFFQEVTINPEHIKLAFEDMRK